MRTINNRNARRSMRTNANRRTLNCTAVDYNYIPETACYIVISNDGVQDDYDVFDSKEDAEDFLYDLIESTYDISVSITGYEDRVQAVIDDIFKGTHPDYKVVIGYKH